MAESSLTAVTQPDGAPRTGGAVGVPGELDMARPSQYTTIAVPNELFLRLERMVPKYSRSVSAYVVHWATLGMMVDLLVDSHDELEDVMDRIVEAVKQGGKR